MKESRLESKVAVIVGAAGGIGSEIAVLFDKKGVRLVLADVDRESLTKAASKLAQSPLLVWCDIREIKDVQNLMKQAVDKFGRIDILVNSAGIIRPGFFEDTSYADIQQQVNINLMGVIYCIRGVIPFMKVAGGGSIVTISSIAGLVPETFSAIYSATKYALRGLGLTLHLELKRHNICVSTVFPDSVDTPMLRYEATHGGSPLTFLSPPQSPATVAKAVYQAVEKEKIEQYVPYFQGLFSKVISVCPWAIIKLWPVLEKSSLKNKEKFRQKYALGEQNERQ